MKFIALVFTLLMGSACASYHMGHYKRALPGGYDRVAIPMFQNKTEEAGVEVFLTKSLRNEFERSGLAQVTSKNDAQVILEGSIEKITYSGGNATNADDTTGLQAPNPNTADAIHPLNNPLPKGTTLNRAYTINLDVQITAKKVSDNSILWKSSFSSQRNYAAPLIGTPSKTSVNALYNQNSRRDTLEKQSKDLMSEAHDRLTENF